MSGSNRTDQLLQQAVFPKVKTISEGAAWDMVVDMKCDTLTARTVQADNLLVTITDFGGADGTLFLGLDAGKIGSNRPGTTAVGVNVGSNSANISNNVLVGQNVLRISSNVRNSVFLGSMGGATQNVSNVSASVFIGYQSGFSNARGSSHNVAVGYLAGRNLNGDSNILIGSFTGSNLSGVGNIFLGGGMDASLNTSNTFLLGNSPGQQLLNGKFPTNSNIAQLGVGKAPEGVQALDVSGDGRFTGSVFIEGDLTVSGGPIGSDICTGQVVLGTNVPESRYPSLLCLSGGGLFNNGFVAVNQPSNPNLQSLDVSGTSRIVGGSVFSKGSVAINQDSNYEEQTLDVSGTSRITENGVFNKQLAVNQSSNPNVYELDVSGDTQVKGQIIVGCNAPLASSVSLRCVSGSALFQNGSVAINYPTNPNVQSLDVSGTARISDLLTVDEVNICGGALTWQNGSNNTMGGLGITSSAGDLTLLDASSNVRLYAYRSDTATRLELQEDGAKQNVNLQSSYLNGNAGFFQLVSNGNTPIFTVQNGTPSISTAGSTIPGCRHFEGSNRGSGDRWNTYHWDAGAGGAQKTNRVENWQYTSTGGIFQVNGFGPGGSQFQQPVQIGDPSGGFTGSLNVTNSGGTTTMSVNGTLGAISNSAGSSNTIGGVVLSNTYVNANGAYLFNEGVTVLSNSHANGWYFRNSGSSNVVTIFPGGGVQATSFTGDGSGLTNLSASQVTGMSRTTVDAVASNILGTVQATFLFPTDLTAAGTQTIVSTNGGIGNVGGFWTMTANGLRSTGADSANLGSVGVVGNNSILITGATQGSNYRCTITRFAS